MIQDNAGKKRIALITGASSGIGAATAKNFAKNNIDLILCARRKDRIDYLAKELSPLVRTKTLCFDVKNKEEVFKALGSLPEDWKNIDILLNNAGSAQGLDSFENASLDDWDEMMDSNVKGLYYVTKAILPQMIERKQGHIINIGSIAGKEVYPNGNGYCASKFAVNALSSAMRIDLNKFHIKVSTVNPGLVNTEFASVRFKGDEDKAKQVYKGLQPLSAEDVADVIAFMATRPHHVNVADVILFPLAQASSMHTTRE